jgi:fatty-acid desaturase
MIIGSSERCDIQLGDKSVSSLHAFIMIHQDGFVAVNFDLWLYTLAFPAFTTLHSYSIQTSMNHSKSYGYKNYEQDNNAVNVAWLFPFILGETWHNNHHADAKNPNYGHRHWWELDPTYWIICLIKK